MRPRQGLTVAHVLMSESWQSSLQDFFHTKQWGNSADCACLKFCFCFFRSDCNSRQPVSVEKCCQSHCQARPVDTGVWGLPVCVGEESRERKRTVGSGSSWAGCEAGREPSSSHCHLDHFLLCIWVLTFRSPEPAGECPFTQDSAAGSLWRHQDQEPPGPNSAPLSASLAPFTKRAMG